MKANFDLEARAAEAFVHDMLPGDKARVGSFAKYIQIDPEDFTSDRDKLLNILRTELQNDGPTPLWNAVDRGIDKLLIEQGRRVILVFTDGVDMPMNFSNHNKSLKDVMKRAEENDVMVYAIGLAGQNGMPTPSGGGAGSTAAAAGCPPNPFGGRGRPGDERRPDAAANGEAGRGAAEDRGGDRRRILRADLAARPGIVLRARGQRTASPVRARLHTREARRKDARPHAPSLPAGARRACPEALSRVEGQVTRERRFACTPIRRTSSPLPSRPSLEQHEKLRERSRRSVPVERTRRHRRVGCPVSRVDPGVRSIARQTLTSRDCALTGAQFVIARAHGFETWPIFAAHLEDLQKKESPVSMFEAAAEAVVAGDIRHWSGSFMSSRR